MTDTEFLELYSRIDRATPLDHNSSEVDEKVALESGLSAEEVRSRFDRLVQPEQTL